MNIRKLVKLLYVQVLIGLILIVANNGSNTVSVLLNTTAPGAATPSFAAQQTFATGTTPHSVTAADLNGDGTPDLIVANQGSNTVSVLLNTTAPGAATPSFAAQQTFATGTTPVSVTAADVNGDGKFDLIVANYNSNTVSVLLNTTAPGAATPSFAAQQTFATGNGPASVKAADLNNDGKPDLIVANYGSNTVSVLLNTTAPGAATPSFAAQQIFTVGSIPRSVTAADLNGDGMSDLIVANQGSNTVSVLLNTQYAASAIPASVIGTIHYSIAQLGLSTGMLAFGNQTVGTSATQTVTLSNSGGAAANLTGITVGGPDASLFSESGNCPLSLAAGSSCIASMIYTPNTLASNTATLTVSSDAPSSPDTVALSGTGIDTVPVAAAGSVSTGAGQAVSGQAQATDTDPGQVLIFGAVTAPAHGTVNVNTDGRFTYTPASGYVGSDSFTFQANDGYLPSNIATVTVTVGDHAPVAAAGSVSTGAGQAVSGRAQATDTDPGQVLTFGAVTAPAHGTVNVNTDGRFTYTPASGYVGSDSFTFQANDGYLPSNIATVTVTVGDHAPVATGHELRLDANKSISGMLNVTDADSGQMLTYSIVSGTAHGTVDLSSDGSFIYTPDKNYVGSDSFTFKANDGFLDSNIAKESFTVAQGGLVSRGGPAGGAFGPLGLVVLGVLATSGALRRRKLAPHPRQVAALATGPLLALLLTIPVFSLFWNTSAQAAAPGIWYAGLQGNVIDAADGRNVSTNGPKGWTFLLGRHFGEHAAVEFSRAYYSENPRNLTASANWVSYGINGLWYPWANHGRFAPFALLAAGHLYEYRGDGSEPVSNYMAAGIGFTSRPWKAPVVLRVDFQAQHAFSGSYTDRILSIGLTFPFGRD